MLTKRWNQVIIKQAVLIKVGDYNVSESELNLNAAEKSPFFNVNNIKYEFSVSQRVYIFFKRFLDIFFACIAVIFLSPLLLFLSLMIKLTSRGPVIFSQERIGQFGKVIRIYKFRTMMSKAPKSKATNDFNDAHEYITKFGKLLRVTSLDEMPQLFNVIKGDMSLIGPRPLILDEIFIHKLREKNDVYLIKPGITGLAQVNGRDFLDAQDKVNFDTQYLHEMSLKLDLIIFIKSLVVVFRQENSLDAKRK